MISRAAAALALVLMGGCMTAQTYEGPKRGPEEVARISGDYLITAGAPLTVILRQVDGRALRLGQSAVDVLPGEHQLLVDCRIAETGSVSRHSIEVDVAPGRHYRLTAQTGPSLRSCTSVVLQEVL